MSQEVKQRRTRRDYLNKFEKIEIEAKRGEDIKNLLRRFKKAVERSGIAKDLKKHSEYEKPSQKRKREERKRIKNVRKFEEGDQGDKKR